MTSLGKESINATNAELADDEVAILQDTTIDWEALRPKITDSETYDKLIAAVEQVERRMIREALDRHGWVKSRTARDLGITQRILSYKMMSLGIERFEQ